MSEIVVYAQITKNGLNPETAELVTAAQEVAKVSGGTITVLAADGQAPSYEDALKLDGVSDVILLHTVGIGEMQADVLSKVIADVITSRDVSTILAPSEHQARALLSRIAVKLDAGMTAACKELKPEAVDGKVVVHQIKSSFGSQGLVTCDITTKPAIITLIPGSYEAAPQTGTPKIQVIEKENLTSALEVLDFEESQSAGNLLGAKRVVCVGKGAIEGENFNLAKAYAEKIGAAFAGSRPMADQHRIDFEAQIGESGTVIRPEACLICGVSGAIQFTEGIKGDPLVIAINKDPKAPIFGFADYKVVADMKDILPELLAAADQK